MLPNEIDPYEFKFFIKDILPLSETYRLFRNSKLLKARETVKAISKTNQGLIVLIHKPRETIVYTPENKITYFTKKRKNMAPKNAVTRFLKAKMIDFVILRFGGFYCCLSRWDKDICSFCIVACIGGRATEKALLNPSEILGEVEETPPIAGKGVFKFKDLDFFSDPKACTDPSLEANDSSVSETLSSINDVRVNPIDFSQEKDDLKCAKEDSTLSNVNAVPGEKKGSKNCLIEITSGNTENASSKPYKEVKNDEEGLIDYIVSKITKLVCEDINTGCLQENKGKSKSWKIIEEDEESDCSSKEPGDDVENQGSFCRIRVSDEEQGKRNASSSGKSQIETSRCGNTIKFGVIDDGKLRCVQKSVGLLSMGNFDRLEAFIIGIIDRLKETNIDYIEVCSEIDFFIVKKKSSIYLYIRDLIHKKERRFMERFSEMFGRLGTVA
ncbi:hypothetical protein [Encephalitozoon cuniculi GB-M1]|uniref:Uncharacterized protein n=1 Tax=Encephalitozoon cuniculi (strain GB-M1) TaxID=284813 RepID=Q8SWQ3_ENCCU|nr:uncharacterized protein ECU01_0280 [Encephalitozoon cuniculi GB-M1]CAD24897.1 hypothetical protein [Encephalitozoon cuniculi GB-M1]